MTDLAEKARQSVLSKLCVAITANKVFLLYTLANFINQIAYGINLNIVGATLIDLQYVYHTSLGGISMVATMTSLGYTLGSLVGWLYRWLNRQLILIGFIVIHAISIAVVPFCGQLWLLLANMVLNGMGGGVWDSSNSVWIAEMYTNHGSVTLQASKFMYGIGTIIGPLLASSFVYGEAENNSSAVFNVTAQERQQSLALPFAVAGIVQMITPIFLLIMFMFAPYERKLDEKMPNTERNRRASIYNTINSRASFQSLRSNVNYRQARHPSIHIHEDEKIIDPDRVKHRFLKLSLCAISIGAYCAVELNYFAFSSVYFQKSGDNPLSATESARVLSLLAFMYAIGRLLTAFISIKVVPDIIVVYHLATLIVGQSITFLWGRHSHAGIYVGTIITGLGFSAIWPGILAFTERHLRLNDRVGSIFSLITGLLSLSVPLIISQYLNTFPQILFLLSSILIPVSLIVFIVAIVFIRTTC